ncbi:MAG: CHAT domain-containing protein, partial [Rhodothermales bacterium]|nr:CHAT domain-containing protein [Rhodothermales bacterium]
MDFLDFVIKITGKSGDEFTVNVESPAGQGQSTLRLPYDPDDLVTILQALGATFRGGGQAPETTTDTQADTPDGIVGRGERISVSVPKPTDVGLKLFEHLLTGEARALFNRSVGRVQENDNLGLRLKLQLNLDDPDVARLARLPWELLYSKEEHEYLNLIGKYPLVRHLAISQPEKSEVIYPPLRVLVVMSSPKGVVELDLEHERKLIEENWADHDNVEVTFLDKATLENINKQVIENEYHVLHYMGHGDFDPESGQGVLVMEDDDGNPDPVPAHALSVVLRKAKKMRLIFLNACETAKAAESTGQDPFAGVATALVMANVGDVLAMQFPISDKAAIKFSQAFYWSIASGLPIDSAVSEGRSAIKLALPNSMEWATPVLFMRSETGVFFDIKQPSAPEPGPQPTPPDPIGPRPAPSPARRYALYGALAVVAAVAAYILWPKAPPDLSRLEWAHGEAISLDMDVPEASRNTTAVRLGLIGCNEWSRGGC